MMSKLIFLAGNNIHNRARIHALADKFKTQYPNIYVQDYQHRGTEYPNMNLEEELEILINETQNDTNQIIIAKSLGCILALMLMIEKGISPYRCVFMGFPMGFIDSREFPFDEYLSQIKTPILFIQKSNDPAGGFQKIKDNIGGLSDRFSFQEIEGADHQYENIPSITKIILDYIK